MNSGLFLTIFALYILLLIVLSWFVSRQHKTGEAFLLSNRRVPFFQGSPLFKVWGNVIYAKTYFAHI